MLQGLDGMAISTILLNIVGTLKMECIHWVGILCNFIATSFNVVLYSQLFVPYTYFVPGTIYNFGDPALLFRE